MHEDEKTILIETEQRAKANTHRIDKIEVSLKELNKENRAIYKIASSVEVMAQKIGTIDEKVDDIKKKVDDTATAQQNSEKNFLQKISEIEHAPEEQLSKNVNSIKVGITTSIITFVATGVIAAVVALIVSK
ncbi:MAG: hypothetical protein SOX82_07510 [Eubacteriales bacterium]|nr:hypothetical protein [Eubacteriales bacterium]